MLRSSVIKPILSTANDLHRFLVRVSFLRKGKRFFRRFSAGVRTYQQKCQLSRQLKTLILEESPNISNKASQFLENLQIKGDQVGKFLYSLQGTAPILYASIYGALLYDLFDKIDRLTLEQRREWIDYINSFQSKDGLYRDPLLETDIAESIDWWGWRHLSAHVISALTALGGKPRHSFQFLDFLYIPGQAYRWICALPWSEGAANASNTVMNYGVLLQYERDFCHNEKAGAALAEIYDFLDKNISPDTGLWGNPRLSNCESLSEAVQTSYHLWNLYFYDRRPIPYVTKGIDSCLKTQNKYGGFGCFHNSSACEDIDSIDPLCRFYFITDYRRADIERCLKNACKWVSINQMNDGGFVFRKFEHFKYGHELMETQSEESSLFATWFRMLSIAYIQKVLGHKVSGRDFKLELRCPGYQFWNISSVA